MLEDAVEINVELIRKVLMATHQEGAVNTVYSNIYDLRNGLVYLYHFHNFENVVVIDLHEELKHGLRILDIPSLFPETFAAISNARKLEFDMTREKRISERLADGEFVRLAKDELAQFTGTYSGEWLGDMQYQFMLVEGGLFARFMHSGMEAMPLAQVYPVSGMEFVQPGVRGDNRYVFEKDADGKVVGLEIRQPGGWGYSLSRIVNRS
jgi:hypothetical protein